MGDAARRVVAKVEFHCEELFPRVGFIVTTLEMDSRAEVRFYNKRETAEQWIREGKQTDEEEDRILHADVEWTIEQKGEP